MVTEIMTKEVLQAENSYTLIDHRIHITTREIHSSCNVATFT